MWARCCCMRTSSQNSLLASASTEQLAKTESSVTFSYKIKKKKFIIRSNNPNACIQSGNGNHRAPLTFWVPLSKWANQLPLYTWAKSSQIQSSQMTSSAIASVSVVSWKKNPGAKICQKHRSDNVKCECFQSRLLIAETDGRDLAAFANKFR